MLKRILIILAAIVAVINLSLNASAQSFMDKMKGIYVDNISQVKDKDIVQVFMKVSPTGKIEGVSPDLHNFKLLEIDKS